MGTVKSHVLIIRFHYAQDDERFEWRLNYFKAMVLPRILNQTNNNFDIAIRCNPWHKEIFESLSPRIKTFQVKNEGARYKIGKRGLKYFHDFVKWDDVIGLEKYDIQTGIDSDDLIGPEFMEKVNQAIEGEHESVHVCFQPMLFDLRDMKTRGMRRYGPGRGSAFLSLYQPDKKDYKFLYCDSHISMWKYAKKSKVIASGHCWATAHWLNESTGVQI